MSNSSLIFGIGGNSQNPITSNETYLTVAIADIIIYDGLSFNIGPKPILEKVMELSRYISNNYSPPNINVISKGLLHVIHEQNTKSNLAMIKK